jgi:hypothetical protein
VRSSTGRAGSFEGVTLLVYTHFIGWAGIAGTDKHGNSNTNTETRHWQSEQDKSGYLDGQAKADLH